MAGERKNMKWYPYLYVGEGASKKKNKIIRKLKIGAGMIDVWVITEAANGEDQFDILSSADDLRHCQRL